MRPTSSGSAPLAARRHRNGLGATNLRREARARIDALSPDDLRVALDFLGYLQEREAWAATEELLRIPGFVEDFEAAQEEVHMGKVTPIERLRRKR